MVVSGEKRNNVTVKMNGRFWDEKRDDASNKESVKEEKVPRKRTPIPFPTQPIVQNGNEAWDRLIQMRGRAERETGREPGILLEETGHVEEDLGENVFSKKPATRLLSTLPKGPIMRTLVSTGGAIAIGLLFGFLVLTVFSEKELSQSYRNVLGDTVQTLTAQGSSDLPASKQSAIAGPVLPGVDRPVADSPVTTSGTQTTVKVQLPEVKMFVAQAGVFQPDASAQAATEPLDKLSIPHLLYKDNAKQYMFAAAAPTRDAILGFAANLKNKGVDVYVKEFSFPAYQGTVAVTAAASSGTQPDLQAFFANGV
ncbi:MAG: hypothetical protein K0R47_1231, partial [Brevibacillus sp.]|nr:hypothetical protein [Brevibacillus sp.]